MFDLKKAKISLMTLIIINSMLIGVSIFHNETALAATLTSEMPTVFVDPQEVIANPGESFTISVKIFNLTNNIYEAGDSLPLPPSWDPGEPLPLRDGRYNYSLGNLYGFDIQLKWDPEVLEYVDHVVKVPVETYTDGVLHQPITEAIDDLDREGGLYWVAKSSTSPAAAFNNPDSNSTFFEVTFNVKKLGTCVLNITSDLAIGISLPQYKDAYREIPHWTLDGNFRTGTLATSIESFSINPLVGTTAHDLPVIEGEDTGIQVVMTNNNDTFSDTYDLNISRGTTVLQTWSNRTLTPGQSETLDYTVDGQDLSMGNHTFSAYVTSTLLEGVGAHDEATKEIRVIGVPTLEIQGPNTKRPGEDAEFSATATHGDLLGQVKNYTWSITAPGETAPRETLEGREVTFELDRNWSEGIWTVTVVVLDNYGLKYDQDRPLTGSYRKESPLTLTKAGGPGFFTLENIVLILILVIIIAAAAFYIRRRAR